MKLKNKLIPLMSVATLAATVAPVTLTACGGNNTISLINGYTPTITKAKWEDYTASKDDMLAFYASAVHENPEILSQDIYWRDSTQMLFAKDLTKYRRNTTVTFSTLESKISNVVIRQCPCEYTDAETGETVTVKYYTISLDYSMHYAYDSKGYVMYGGDSHVPGTESVDSTITISCQNIPFTINRNNTTRETIRSNAYYLSYFYDTEVQSMEAEAFYYGFMPTDWLVQFLCYFIIDETSGDVELNHDAFTHLENNGFDWFIKSNETINATTTTAISDPIYNEYVFNSALTKDSQFDDIITKVEKLAKEYTGEELLDKIEEQVIRTLDGHAILNLICWYLPSYYLSDIIDANSQIWG